MVLAAAACCCCQLFAFSFIVLLDLCPSIPKDRAYGHASSNILNNNILWQGKSLWSTTRKSFPAFFQFQ